MSQLKAVRQEEFLLTGRGNQPFCSIQASNWSDEAHPYWGRQSVLLRLQIQILISSKNTLEDIPRIMFDQVSGHPLAQLTWHVKVTTRKRKDTYHFENYQQTAHAHQRCSLSLPSICCYEVFWFLPIRATLLFLFFSFFWPHHAVCRILVPRPGIKPGPSAVEARTFNHWTTREVLWRGLFIF